MARMPRVAPAPALDKAFRVVFRVSGVGFVTVEAGGRDSMAAEVLAGDRLGGALAAGVAYTFHSIEEV